jgi:epoxyqueuosine reductase
VILQTIDSIIKSQGCLFLGVAELREDLLSFSRFERWLEDGRGGSMPWLENYSLQRKDSSFVEPGCNRSILIAIPYSLPTSNDSTHQIHRNTNIAKYARFEDYHKFASRMGANICKQLQLKFDGERLHKWRAVSDTAPILERALHANYSSGFIGKNTMFIHPKWGSWLLLMEILTSYPFDSEKAPTKSLERTPEGGCGTCKRCQVHCPTGALDQDYRMDARKCLSYLTIENRSTVEVRYWVHFAKYWYGCDICQNVCPYNRGPKMDSPLKLKDNANRDLFDIVQMDQKQYEEWFGGTAMTRAKRNGLRRNAFIAMAALDHPRVRDALQILKSDGDLVLLETANQYIDHWQGGNI